MRNQTLFIFNPRTGGADEIQVVFAGLVFLQPPHRRGGRKQWGHSQRALSSTPAQAGGHIHKSTELEQLPLTPVQTGQIKIGKKPVITAVL
ncbi:hypothetical protein ACNA96_003036 [Escherichia coli]|nr:hypothetical protein [Escherichia coli]